MIYVFLADGFEEIETFGTIDILRRCNLQVQTLSVTGKRVVTSARNIIVKADSLFRKNHLSNCEALVFPGGLKGAETMARNTILHTVIQQHFERGTLIAAICAGPIILSAAGILVNRHITIYPGMQSQVGEALYHDDAFVVEHDNLITGCGPAATRLFATSIARRLVIDAEIVAEVERGMCFTGHAKCLEQVLRF